MSARKVSRGFSLIELAVTLAVLALVMSAAMPSIGAWMGNVRIRNTAESLQNGLQKARNEAVKANQPVSFYLVSLGDPKVMSDDCKISSQNGSWVVSGDDPTGKCGATPSNATAPRIVASHPIGDGGDKVTVSATQTDGSAATHVTFNSFGQVANADFVSKLKIESSVDSTGYRSFNVVVTQGGRILMCEPSVADTTDPRHCP